MMRRNLRHAPIIITVALSMRHPHDIYTGPGSITPKPPDQPQLMRITQELSR
jgi:hypothetical protein